MLYSTFRWITGSSEMEANESTDGFIIYDRKEESESSDSIEVNKLCDNNSFVFYLSYLLYCLRFTRWTIQELFY